MTQALSVKHDRAPLNQTVNGRFVELPLADRLEANTYHDAMTGCWLYAGNSTNGYPLVFVHGKRRTVHRAAWELLRGPIPVGMFVCHRCDTPACWNPDHLFLGSPAENFHDMRRKGRANAPPRRLGSASRHAKLIESDIPVICADYERGQTTRQIAAEYGVSLRTIGDVLNGRGWKHVPVARPLAAVEAR